jgi:hypothetical protein
LALSGHTDDVLCATFSPDGRLFATGGRDKTVRVWDARTGRSLALFPNHSSGVIHVAFRAEGLQLVSTDDRNVTCHWDVATGSLLTTTPGPITVRDQPSLPIGGAARIPSPDGRTAAYLAKQAVFLVRPPSDHERVRRLWATRPDPLWHEGLAERFAAENLPFAAEFHRNAARKRVAR